MTMVPREADVATSRFAPAPPPKPRPADVKAFTGLLTRDASECIELRVIGPKNGVGYFQDLSALEKVALSCHGRAHVYVGLNPRPADLLHAQPANQVKWGGEGGKDHEIACRRWFPIDIDTARPNKRIAASEPELARSRPVADEVAAFLKARGVPAIFGFSGNGWHLLIRMADEPVGKNKPEDDKVALLLRWFSRRFSTEHASVDVGNYNASRVWKLYGTAAVKGGNTVERPHRTAAILEIPPDLAPNDVFKVFAAEIEEQREQELRSRAAPATARAVAEAPAGSSAWWTGFAGDLKTLDLAALFQSKGAYRHQMAGGKHAVVCPWSSEHTTEQAHDTSTVVFAGEGDAWPGFKCLHSHCVSRGLRDVLEHFGDPEVSRFCREQFRARAADANGRERAAPSPRHEPFAPPPVKRPSRSLWPAPLLPEALHGLAGDVVRTIEPHTEADNAAILVQFLVAFGNVIGRGPHWFAEDDRHSLNLMAVVVGNTSAGRKGTSWKRVKQLFKEIDPVWAKLAGREGLQSGEGLVYAVRDPPPDGGAGPDKRLLLVESEFATILKNSRREGSILSAVIRKAWDDGTLDLMSKNSPVSATDAHVSIVGHITLTELYRLLTETEEANGFANRFLWVCAKRSKLLPEGGTYSAVDRQTLEQRLRAAVDFSQSVERMDFTAEAAGVWQEQYRQLSIDYPGRLGRVVTRAAPQVRRLACIYALLDRASRVGFEHLAAALAIWEYCLASARHIFGDSTGDRVADKLLAALRQAPAGMSRTELLSVFHNNKTKDEIDAALELLESMTLARGEVEVHARGRPGERWFATPRVGSTSSGSSMSSNS